MYDTFDFIVVAPHLSTTFRAISCVFVDRVSILIELGRTRKKSKIQNSLLDSSGNPRASAPGVPAGDGLFNHPRLSLSRITGYSTNPP